MTDGVLMRDRTKRRLHRVFSCAGGSDFTWTYFQKQEK